MEENDYERQRAAKIAENKAKLAELGLIEASRALLASAGGPGVLLEAGSEVQPRKKRRVAKEAEAVVLQPTRLSSRIRGEAAPSQAAAAAAAREAAEREEAQGRRGRGSSRAKLELLEGVTYGAPFMLIHGPSAGITVWELGEVYRGPWAHRYWSSSGCLYHHAYPVGYRASKVQFGRTYEMAIEAGPTGPIFKVIDQKTGTVFSGESPTKPWTDVCLAHRTGQRISGPLFFGFSDIVTQRAIAELYTPEELQAALQGERVECATTTAEERAAREFRSVDGVGEATARALAFTAQLGGVRHRSLEGLRAWVRESGFAEANQEQLREWLNTSSELPPATLKWPLWPIKMVPKIVAGLASDGSSSSDAEAAAPAAAAAAAGGSVPGGRAKARGSARAAGRAGAAAGVGGQQAGEASGLDTAVVSAGDSRAWEAGPARAKENRPANSSARGMAGSKAAASKAEAGAAAAPARASGRQRKTNSKYEQFVVELAD